MSSNFDRHASSIRGLQSAESSKWAPLRTCGRMRSNKEWLLSREGVEGPGSLGLHLATLKWVWWFKHHRILEPIGYVPPVEFEEEYYRRQPAPTTLASLT
jgi:transposase InsO family protein